MTHKHCISLKWSKKQYWINLGKCHFTAAVAKPMKAGHPGQFYYRSILRYIFIEHNLPSLYPYSREAMGFPFWKLTRHLSEIIILWKWPCETDSRNDLKVWPILWWNPAEKSDRKTKEGNQIRSVQMAQPQGARKKGFDLGRKAFRNAYKFLYTQDHRHSLWNPFLSSFSSSHRDTVSRKKYWNSQLCFYPHLCLPFLWSNWTGVQKKFDLEILHKVAQLKYTWTKLWQKSLPIWRTNL